MKSENKESGFLKKLSRRSLFKSTGIAALGGLAGCGESKEPLFSTPARAPERWVCGTTAVLGALYVEIPACLSGIFQFHF